jgi:hypothetical protein
MNILMRNCAHGSTIYVIQCCDVRGTPQAIRKAASVPAGIADLRREVAGIRWYNKYAPVTIPVAVERAASTYVSVQYGFITGRKYAYQRGYHRNRRAIAQAVDHYCDVWSAASVKAARPVQQALHGDLSLDNVLYTSEGPVFIDWEHFAPHAAPIGYDAVYLLCECLWFESAAGTPRRGSVVHAARMLKALDERGCIAPHLLTRPVSGVIRFIEEHKELWGEQLNRMPHKLPVLLWSAQAVHNLDRCIDHARVRATHSTR